MRSAVAAQPIRAVHRREDATKPITTGHAISQSRRKFTPVRYDGSLWCFETFAFGAKEAASRDYYQVVRIKNREVICHALWLFGWQMNDARAFADQSEGRGTHYELMKKARVWREGRQRRAA